MAISFWRRKNGFWTETRKKAFSRCIWGFFACAFLSVVGFFMVWIPPFALAVPAPIWTFWGFQALIFITNTEFSLAAQKKAAVLNFFFVVSAMFACPWIVEIESDAQIFRIIGIIAFAVMSAAEIRFWLLFLKRHFPEFKVNMK